LNQGPSGYEPDELPDCSTPRNNFNTIIKILNNNIYNYKKYLSELDRKIRS
jgi:hypothetical protein